MTRIRHTKNFKRDVARAPYNFVPLPHSVIDVRHQFGTDANVDIDLALPNHNAYLPDRLSGWLDVQLTTESLTYIRAGRSASDVDSTESPSAFFSTREDGTPVIPGSSLRGMLRSLFEIVTYSKLDRLNAGQGFFYRAVAAKRDDPLKTSYEKIMGRPEEGFGSNVRPGYLIEEDSKWFILPALQIAKGRWIEKIKDDPILVGGVRNLIRFNDPDYHLQTHPVIMELMKDSKGKSLPGVRSPRKDERATATLICSGNMNETQGGRSPRTRYAAIGLPDEKSRPLRIVPEAVEAYRLGLSPFVQQELDKEWGVLKTFKPVFYIQSGKQVVYFGHTPYFRVPATRMDEDKRRVVSAYDFVPEELRSPNTIDLAEAIFGFVRDRLSLEAMGAMSNLRQGDKQRAYAGRVQITDAFVVDERNDRFTQPITLKVLATPKPTTFQHYLTQEKDEKPELRHYDRNGEIRGHKLYWRQRQRNVSNITTQPQDIPQGDMKPATIQALKPCNVFRFRVYFDNLTKIELGALIWTVTLPGQDSSQPSPYRHMIGMGKALGMGVVHLEASLTQISRSARYRALFSQREDGSLIWNEGIRTEPESLETYLAAFEDFMRNVLPREDLNGAQRFHDIERIRMLLTMLEGRDPHSALQHMSIATKEFVNRLILPDPMYVENNQL